MRFIQDMQVDYRTVPSLVRNVVRSGFPSQQRQAIPVRGFRKRKMDPIRGDLSTKVRSRGTLLSIGEGLLFHWRWGIFLFWSRLVWMDQNNLRRLKPIQRVRFSHNATIHRTTQLTGTSVPAQQFDLLKLKFVCKLTVHNTSQPIIHGRHFFGPK